MNLMQPLSIFSQEISGSVFPRFSMSWVTSWAFRSLITFFLPMRNNCGTANTDETTFDGKLLIICNIEIAVGAEGRVDTASIHQQVCQVVHCLTDVVELIVMEKKYKHISIFTVHR